MRIACLYLPGFALQVHVRRAPHLEGVAFAVLAEELPGGKVPRVVAASRAARAEGVRLGMTATQARAVAPGVTLVDAEPAAHRAAMEALGEALMALSVTVDVREPGAAYALVPPGARGATFGERMLEAAARQALRGRVGVADDRFTAWAATQAEPRQPVRAVPSGGSATFLAPLPLELLPLDDDVRRTLVLLGIRTVGDFAALPPPSVGRRWAQGGLDVQALARGEDPRPLEAFVPVEPIRELVDLDDLAADSPAEVDSLEPIAFLLRPLVERVAARLAGRGKAAARAVVTLRGRGEDLTEVTIAPSRPATSPRTLLELARAHLAERKLTHAVRAIEVVVVEEGDAEPIELDLLDRAGPAPGAVDVAIARLRAAFGPEAAFGARLVDRHRPEGAFERVPFADAAAAASPPAARRTILPIIADHAVGALRLIDPPAGIDVEAEGADVDPPPPPRAVAGRRVVQASGPTRLEGEWWTDEPLARDYYEVATEDGGRYWVYRDHADGRFYLHGVFD